MASNPVDIFGSLVLNIDQALFKKSVMQLADTYAKKHQTEQIRTLKGAMRGYNITDFVMTIKVSIDKRNCEVFRNRDGVLVFAMYDNKNSSVNWEYIFIQSHIDELLKKENNERSRP